MANHAVSPEPSLPTCAKYGPGSSDDKSLAPLDSCACMLNCLPASGDFCSLLINFANSLDPEQAQQNKDLISIQSVCHCDGIPERNFRKSLFKKKQTTGVDKSKVAKLFTSKHPDYIL